MVPQGLIALDPAKRLITWLRKASQKARACALRGRSPDDVACRACNPTCRVFTRSGSLCVWNWRQSDGAAS